MRRAILATGRGRRLRVEIPESRRERSRGLTGRSSLKPGDGMLFLRCRSVHTFGMRFPITVVVLDRNLHVLRVKTLPPNRLLWPAQKARNILECAEGILPAVGERAELRSVGDELEEEEADESAHDGADQGG
jgi:uncharacterized membrane protein (UPF0127 family)